MIWYIFTELVEREMSPAWRERHAPPARAGPCGGLTVADRSVGFIGDNIPRLR